MSKNSDYGKLTIVKSGRLKVQYTKHRVTLPLGTSLKMKNYKQRDDHSCSFVAVLTVAEYLNEYADPKTVLELVRPKLSCGSDENQVKKSLRQLGIKIKHQRDLTSSKIRKYLAAGNPIIITVYPDDYSSDHWTVIKGIADDNRVYMTNYKSLEWKQFLKEWYFKGEGIVCFKPPELIPS